MCQPRVQEEAAKALAEEAPAEEPEQARIEH